MVASNRLVRPAHWVGSLLAVLLVFLGAAGPVWGQAPEGESAGFAEEEIIVRASRIESTLLETPAAVGVIGAEEIQLARPQLTLGESLVRVPGVFTQNRENFAQDLRVSIRGFGARARFGLRGVKLIVDGIPATLPDGQGQLDTLQLSTAGRIEVIRGPSASLYGSASGGVIRVESERIGEGVSVASRAGFGSYGYRSYDAKATVRSGSIGLLAGVSSQQLSGYRDHSAMESRILNTRLEWQIDEASELIGLLTVAQSPLADDAGGLTSLQVVQDRRQASTRNLDVDAGERLDQVTTGLRYRRRSGDLHETTVAAWYGHRDFRNRLPILLPEGVTGTLDRSFAGASLQHEYSGDLFGQKNSLLVGFDVEVQRDDRMRDHAGARILDQAEDVGSVRGFIRDELELPNDMAMTFSLGFDDLRYRLDDHLPGAGTGSDRADFSQWSPAFSLRWNPRKALNPYLRISTSFEPPTTTEFRNPASAGGGLNHDLGAQRAVNYEVGAKGLLPGRLRYGVAVYYIDTSDELIPYEDDQFETFYRNAGQTERAGLEIMLQAQITGGLQLTTAYTFSHAEFADYVIDGGANLSGNLVPGVPENTFYAELLYAHSSGFFFSIEGRGVGSFYADDANTVETEGYGAMDFRVGWKGHWGRWHLTPYLAVSNFTETVYDDNVRLNAFGGRYYEPAAGVQVQGGLGVSYRFE